MPALPAPHDYRFVLVTTMKDEGPYILDWIAYHLAIGFTHIVVLTNDCADGTEKLCRNLGALGIVTQANNPPPYPRGIQKTAYKRMARLDAVQNAKWLMALDVDEYLRIDVGDGRLDDLFAAMGHDFDALSFVWQIFGNAGIDAIEDRPVTSQFLRAAPNLQINPYQTRGYKTLFRADRFAQIGTHRPQKPMANAKLWYDANGVETPYLLQEKYWLPLANGQGFGWALGRVDHYALRSLDAFLLKIARGFVNRKTAGVRGEAPIHYWQIFNWNAHETSAILRMDRARDEIKAALLAQPKLTRLHEKAVNHHQERAQSLRQNEDWAKSLIDEINALPAGDERMNFDMRQMEHPFTEWSFSPKRFPLVTTNSILDKNLIKHAIEDAADGI